jgi:beta-xylosidase
MPLRPFYPFTLMSLPISAFLLETPVRGAGETSPAPVAPWVADQGDGSYRNPVLHADYSDPDVVRVGEDYWMTSSSFNHVPGLPILHSRDLVNWTLVNHALPAQVPVEHFKTPRHGEGVWAPSIRHHAGKFWIFYPDPDFGIYVITAEDPRGKWSEPFLLKGGRGLIDPSPLWDEDGRAWLVHGWAKSRAGINNRLTLHEMKPDGTGLLDGGMVVVDADKMPGWRTLEGPKFYKRDGYYYIFAPAGGVAEGYQAVFRARDIRGPYENRIVLEQGATPVNGPHQGAWVDTPAGQHWFFHFQELPAHGRVVHLQPMRWREDGWPVMGSDANNDGTGEPVLEHAKPSLPAQKTLVPATSDSFAGGRPGLQWQWQGNPEANWILRGEAAQRGLRLRAVPAPAADSLWMATNLLMQKFPAPGFTAETTLSLKNPEATGRRAGLVVFGYDYGWIGLRETADGGQELVQVLCARADKGGVEKIVASVPWPSGQPVALRVKVETDLSCHFFFRSAETGGSAPFAALGKPFTASSSRWVGAKVGVFCSAAPGSKDEGHAEFGPFLVGQ